MSITCKICNTDFEKIIPWQHLAKHNVSTADYKKLHGSVYSAETLQKHAAKTPHNKGKKITDPDQLAQHRERIIKREQRYRLGEFKRGSQKTPEQKQHLSDLSTQYAQANPEEMLDRAKKAVATKIKNHYDFGKNMRGKSHSAATRKKISESGKSRVQQKTLDSHKYILDKLAQLNLTLNNTITSPSLELSCDICNSVFSFTKQYFTPSKFKTSMCPVCFPRTIAHSAGETELFDFVKKLCPAAIQGYREKYHSKEIDIFVPELDLGIEFNGLYWHSESTLLSNNRSPTCDFEKSQHFESKGIRIIQVFEDEWNNQKNIVKSRLSNILGSVTNKIYARNCVIKEVSSKDASMFCEQNHLMGRGRSNIRLGLYHNSTLVSLMTFTNSNLSRKLSGVWEINRFASILDCQVVGGASKLFKHFLTQIQPSQVVSYSDNRWSSGKLYQQLGFEKTSNGTPNYWYFYPNSDKRIHRFSLRKNKTDNQLLTEYENRVAQGYLRIWDSGHAKWTWNSKKQGS